MCVCVCVSQAQASCDFTHIQNMFLKCCGSRPKRKRSNQIPQKVIPIDSEQYELQSRLHSVQFQIHFQNGAFEDALRYEEVYRGWIRNDRVYAPAPCMPPLFYLAVPGSRFDSLPKDTKRNVIQVLKQTGGVSTSALYTLTPDGNNALSLRYSRHGFQMFADFGFSLDDIDWNRREIFSLDKKKIQLTRGVTVLQKALQDVRIFERQATLIHKILDEIDARCLELVRRMSDEALESSDAIYLASKFLHVRTLKRLLMRLPGIEIRFVLPSERQLLTGFRKMVHFDSVRRFEFDFRDRARLVVGMLHTAQSWSIVRQDKIETIFLGFPWFLKELVPLVLGYVFVELNTWA